MEPAGRARLSLLVIVLGGFHAAFGGETGGPRHLEPPRPVDALVLVDGAVELEPATREFVARRGGEWSFWIDDRTGNLGLAQGSGIPLIPGRGNDLPPASSTGPVGLDDVEPLVREFLSRERALIDPGRGKLVLRNDTSLVRQDGRLISVYYDWILDGIPVEGALVFVRINSGNVTQFGSRRVGDPGPIAVPVLDATDALRAVLRYSGDAEDARTVGAPRLLLQPEPDGDGLRFRPVWEVRYRTGGIETWEGRVDAVTGEPVGFRDANVYARAVGGIYPRSVFYGGETRVPLPALEVTIDNRTALTDSGGRFAYFGGRVRSVLDGRFFETRCTDCLDPSTALVETGTGIGLVDFGLGGNDVLGNGRSTPAERNVYYHANQIRRVALKWLPNLEWLTDQRMIATVNLDASCNAFFDDDDQSINFLRFGDGCNNTGEIADVIQHEWGHALDYATLVTDLGTGEGTADVAAMHMTRSSLIAPGFRVLGDPIRDLDTATSSLGLMTARRVQEGACRLETGGNSVHCIGQVYGQAAWDLAGYLAERDGPQTGWRTSERLFFTSLPDAGSYLLSSPVAIYPAYLNADDDDGNLANGTPNAVEIHRAFLRHGIAPVDPLPASPHCARPAQPAASVEARCSGFALSWNPVEGAERYAVLRGELTDATLYPGPQWTGGTEVVDHEVAPGIDYWYSVIAIGPDGCESALESPVPARLAPRPILSLIDARAEDVLRGNRSGTPDPGEEVEVYLSLGNLGELGADVVSAEIRALTPGVEVLTATLEWPSVAPGESVSSSEPLRLAVQRGETCGARLRFELTPQESSGCAGTEPSYFDVQVGTPDGNGGFVCDPTPPCFEPARFDGLAVAAPGTSCGEIDLVWPAAESQCTNAQITYEVFRSPGSDVAPVPENRIATHLGAPGFTDRLLEPGREYAYLVRAIDSRSGEESNSVVRTAPAAVDPDLAPPAFDGLTTLATGEACGEVALTWSPALETCSVPVSYEIYRSKDPLFVPGPANRIGSTLAPGFVDVGLEPAGTYWYVVRARDTAGNESTEKKRASVIARAFDRVIVAEAFENNDGGWRVVEPNDAERGNWEWGDPEEAEAQPEDDATPDGARCWFTGLAAQDQFGENGDVDFGTTTLLSTRYQLAGLVDPVVRFARWFTNDTSGNAGDPRDSFRMFVSNDDGATWHRLYEVGGGTPLAWVTVELPFGHIVDATDGVRFRFQASDIGQDVLDVSRVEAGIDDFHLLDRHQACAVCSGSVAPVDTIRVARDGSDVVLDWTEDPAPGTRFAVYKLEGPDFAGAVRIGTTTGRSFVHRGAADTTERFAYRVAVVDECGRESPLR